MPSRDRSLERSLDRAVPIGSEGANLEGVLRSVMKVYVTSVEADYTQPWQVYMEEECTGSGFAISLDSSAERLAIVTNAHVVASFADIRVRKFGEVHKYKARCLMVAHTADVALLAVDEARFWHKVAPLEFGEVPRLYENVKVLGYPMGGDNACVTRGVVSRVDTTSYVRGAENLLVVQIDAAINPGNSGGPALDDRSRVAGVAFSGFSGTADNIGYIIPRVVVQNVVADYLEFHDDSTGAVKWTGLCSLGLWTQACENPALRRKLRMGDDVSGVLITRVAALGCGARAGVREGDVLASLAGVAVANDGSVPLRGSERVHADHLVTCRRQGEQVDLEILRDGLSHKLQATLAPLPRLVPICDGFDATPAYVVVAGLVLMALSAPLISAVTDDEDDDDKASFSRYVDLMERDQAEPDTEIVVWTQTLSHDVNFGYAELCRHLPRLKRVNGHLVTSLAHVVALTRFPAVKPTFLELEFLPSGAASAHRVVIDFDLAKSAEQSLLKRSKVPAPYSPELRPAIKALSKHRSAKDPHDDCHQPESAETPSGHKKTAASARRGRRKTQANAPRAPPAADDDAPAHNGSVATPDASKAAGAAQKRRDPPS